MRKPPHTRSKRTAREPVRLNKLIAASGKCSRREADKLIGDGKVFVNGKKITDLGTKVFPDAKIRIDNQVISRDKQVYILMNKPKDVITTTSDPEGRKTVTDLLGDRIQARVFPVGRLDRNTTGVLLLTNDGDLAEKLTHPKYGVEKIYEVKLSKGLTESDLLRLREGIELEDGPFKMENISFPDQADRSLLGVQIHSGRNRIIRRSFEHIGYEVVKLDRVSFAGLTKKNLSRGRWRRLSPKEVAWLKMKKGKK